MSPPGRTEVSTGDPKYAAGNPVDARTVGSTVEIDQRTFVTTGSSPFGPRRRKPSSTPNPPADADGKSPWR